MYKLFRQPTTKKAVLIAFAVLYGYTLAVLPLNPFQLVRLKLKDFLTDAVLSIKKPPPELNDLALVVLDDATFVTVNQRWPWDRKIYGDLIDKLAAQKPKLIVMDMTFVGQSPDPESDRRIAESLRRAGNVLVAYYVGELGEAALPLPTIGSSSLGAGFINKPVDLDFTIRRVKACYRSVDGAFLDWIDYALELQAAAYYFGAAPSLSEVENVVTFKKARRRSGGGTRCQHSNACQKRRLTPA
ncbi:MAG: CHASE2 domain-containing protein [Candidatus Omnitrophota bacterium]